MESAFDGHVGSVWGDLALCRGHLASDQVSVTKCLDIQFRRVKDRHLDGIRDAFLCIKGGKISARAAAWVFSRCP